MVAQINICWINERTIGWGDYWILCPCEESLHSFELVGFSHKVSPTLTLSTLDTVLQTSKGFAFFGTSVTAQVTGDVPLTASACSAGLFSGLKFEVPHNKRGGGDCLHRVWLKSALLVVLVVGSQTKFLKWPSLCLKHPGKEVEGRGKVVAWKMVAGESENLNYLHLPVNS